MRESDQNDRALKEMKKHLSGKGTFKLIITDPMLCSGTLTFLCVCLLVVCLGNEIGLL